MAGCGPPGSGGGLGWGKDVGGCWNLESWHNAASTASRSTAAPAAWQPLLPQEAEFAMPQWVFGMATTAWDGERLLALACHRGRWQLGEVVLDNAGAAAAQWRPLEQPCDDLAALTADPGQLACVASRPTPPARRPALDNASRPRPATPTAPKPATLEAP